METFHKTNTLEDSTNPPQPPLITMAEALRGAIPRDKLRTNSFRMLDHLARRTMELIREGKEPQIATKEIYIDLDGNPNQGASAWVSTLWKEIETKHYEQIKPIVIQRCREMGLSHYPRPAKLNGSPALYQLEAYPLDAMPLSTAISEREDGLQHSRGAVTYEQDLTLKLSRLGRLVFGSGLAWTLWKKLTLASVIAIITILLLAFLFVGYGVLLQRHTPLSAADVLTLMLVVAGPWAITRKIDELTRIFDDRIVIAPDWALSWKEFGATMELEGEPENGGTRVIKVARYTARCPICDGMLKLDKGEPDFPRRLVGRCSKSPREHVFSFDRITRIGLGLIPPL